METSAHVNTDIVVIGGGGHAKVCIELLRAMNESVAFCVGTDLDPDACLDVPILKGDENVTDLYRRGFRRAFVALGPNALRERLGLHVMEVGYELVNAVSPNAVISPTAKLGLGVAVMAGAIINADAAIDDLVIINTGTTIDHGCSIGRAVHVAPQGAIAGNVTIRAGAFLGIGCTVIPWMTIGRNSTVGAGGVVINDIADDATAVGVPAAPLRTTTQKRTKL